MQGPGRRPARRVRSVALAARDVRDRRAFVASLFSLFAPHARCITLNTSRLTLSLTVQIDADRAVS